MAVLLSLCLALFVADAAVSLLDDSIILLFHRHALTAIRGLVFLPAFLIAIVVYALMGLTPMIPKRLFLPITLFNPAAPLLLIPFAIYFYHWTPAATWVISLCQVLLGMVVLRAAQGGVRFHWPLVPEKLVEGPRFTWRNLCGFLLMNLLLLPAVVLYLAGCLALATDHFSEGFMSVRPGGIFVEARKYARADGKTIQLFPMSHIGDPAFYRDLSQSITTNSIVLMEGVTDERNLLTNTISYKRVAKSLGLAEQQKEFDPSRARVVRADIDVDRFASTTIDLLNLAMLIHTKGVSVETLLPLLGYSPPPKFEEQLVDDLLGKRNRRVLEEVDARLPDSDNLILPWGVAHMPGIAQGIQKAGFHLVEAREYAAIRFGGKRTPGTKAPGDAQKPPQNGEPRGNQTADDADSADKKTDGSENRR